MYYGEPEIPGVQSYVLVEGKIKQESVGTLIQYPQNKTKIIIRKQDENANILPHVKFNVLNSNKEMIYENLETDENGIIEIENMLPGIYYLQETETVEGYEFNKELIELNIELNEEKEIIVENSKIPEKPEIPKLPRTGW